MCCEQDFKVLNESANYLLGPLLDDLDKRLANLSIAENLKSVRCERELSALEPINRLVAGYEMNLASLPEKQAAHAKFRPMFYQLNAFCHVCVLGTSATRRVKENIVSSDRSRSLSDQ